MRPVVMMLAAALARAGLLGFILPCSAAVAADLPPLAPSTKWRVDLSNDQCRMLRTFGNGKGAVMLQLSSIGLDADLSLTIAAASVPKPALDLPIAIMTAGAKPIEAFGISYSNEPSAPALLHVLAAPKLREALQLDVDRAAPGELRVKFRNRTLAALALGPMRPVLRTFDACLDTLLTRWGLDPEQQRRLRKPPQAVGDTTSWLSFGDLPSLATPSALSGIIVTRLSVDASGKPTACNISAASAGSELRIVTCKLLMKRARFTPAIDADGRAVASVWARCILWLPG